MKKIFGLLILSFVTLTSCDNDLLEPFTPGSQTEDVAVTTSGDLERLLNSGMNVMTNRSEYVFSSIYTDEAAPGFNNGGQGITGDYIFVMNVSNGTANSIWNSSYGALAYINRVLAFADDITPVDAADAEIINRIKAHALTLRAIIHIKLLSYYSTDPTDDNALAAVLADRVITTAETPSRATNGAFYTAIHQDLNDAIAIYNTNTAPAYTGITRTYYPSVVLAQAMKARAYALKGDYPNAETYADLVIGSGISLATNLTDYNRVFHTHNEPANTEVIFRLRRTPQQNSQGTNLHNGWCSVNNRRNGSPFYEVSRGLFNAFGGFDQSIPNINQNPDYRLLTNVYLQGNATTNSIVDPNYATATDVRNSDILVLQKHGGQSALTGTNTFNPDFMVSRVSEMYFIKAEARAAANDFPGVASALQSIVNARFTTAPVVATPGSAQAAWKAILDERRKELSFEGFRFIDLKRLGALANTGLDRDPSEYASAAWNFPAGDPALLPVDSYKFTLPIPVSELNANSGIQQNPGY